MSYREIVTGVLNHFGSPENPSRELLSMGAAAAAIAMARHRHDFAVVHEGARPWEALSLEEKVALGVEAVWWMRAAHKINMGPG